MIKADKVAMKLVLSAETQNLHVEQQNRSGNQWTKERRSEKEREAEGSHVYNERTTSTVSGSSTWS